MELKVFVDSWGGGGGGEGNREIKDDCRFFFRVIGWIVMILLKWGRFRRVVVREGKLRFLLGRVIMDMFFRFLSVNVSYVV